MAMSEIHSVCKSLSWRVWHNKTKSQVLLPGSLFCLLFYALQSTESKSMADHKLIKQNTGLSPSLQSVKHIT